MRQSPEESATLFKIGDKRKGLDGNIWIITKTKTGIKRWSKYNNEQDILFKKLYKWWLKLSEGNFIIINKNKKSKLIKSSKKTSLGKIKDLKNKWLELENDKNVIAIIWSGMSIDILENFIKYLLKKNKNIVKEKNIEKYLINNYKKYFVKNKLYTNKDFTFR